MRPRFGIAMGLATVGVALAALSGVAWSMAGGDLAASPAIVETYEAVPTPPVEHAALREQGLGLFVAKGCIACHVHEEAAARNKTPSYNIGPNLTRLPERFPPGEASLDYLRRWLRDPAAIRPGTAMPTLGLSDAEIEALLRFLLREEYFRAG